MSIDQQTLQVNPSLPLNPHFPQQMSIDQQALHLNSSSTVIAETSSLVDDDGAKKDGLGLPSIIDQHLNACVENFLTSINTFQLEFDIENTTGRLPRCFTREFGDTLSEYVVLRDPNQNEFEVHVVRKSNDLYFDDGWYSLKDVYDVSCGAWVTLTYVSSKLLTMRLLARWGVEIGYPSYNPPLRHLLARGESSCGFGSSVLTACSPGSSKPKSFVRTYVKEITIYDIHSGTLSLPWYGFGQSAFAFVFSDLIMVDNAGQQYKCLLDFGVDGLGEFSCNISGGWLDLCAVHGVVAGDRVKFSVAHYFASNVMYVSIYPRVALVSCLDAPGSQQSFA